MSESVWTEADFGVNDRSRRLDSSSLVDAEKAATIASGERAIHGRRRATRSEADESSLGNPGNGV